MERDGLQESLRVLQEEYQSVVKEAKVHFKLSNPFVMHCYGELETHCKISCELQKVSVQQKCVIVTWINK